MKIYIKYLIYSAFLLLFSMCDKKNKGIDQKYVPVPDSLKQMCLFEKGSYWVYRNDSTGEIDCTYVSDNFSKKENDWGHRLVESDSIPVSSSIFDFFVLQGDLGPILYPSNPGSPFLVDLKGYGDCAYQRTAFVLFDDTVTYHEGGHYEECGTTMHGEIFYDADHFRQLGRLQSVPVNGTVYDSVFVTRTSFFVHNYAYDTIFFYYRPRIGLVKIVMDVDTSKYNMGEKYTKISWGLLRYNVQITSDKEYSVEH